MNLQPFFTSKRWLFAGLGFQPSTVPPMSPCQRRLMKSVLICIGNSKVLGRAWRKRTSPQPVSEFFTTPHVFFQPKKSTYPSDVEKWCVTVTAIHTNPQKKSRPSPKTMKNKGLGSLKTRLNCRFGGPMVLKQRHRVKGTSDVSILLHHHLSRQHADGIIKWFQSKRHEN